MSGSIWTAPVAGFRMAATRIDDTIQGIAARETGDAAQWTVLVALNGLVPPYIAPNLSEAVPGVIWAGQQPIRIPGAAPVASGVADPVSVFGTDIALPGGMLSFTSGGDFATVAGVPNLTQAVRNRFATHVLDLIRHPQYGLELYKLLGKGGDALNLRLAAVYVRRCLTGDARISSVSNVSAVLSGDSIVVTATATAVDSKRRPLTVTVPTLGGGSLASVIVGAAF